MDYLIPVSGISGDNQFKVSEEQTAAYSEPIIISSNTMAENINAGVRPVSKISPLAATTYTIITDNFAGLKNIIENIAVSGDIIILSTNITFTDFININNKSLTIMSATSTPVVFTAKTSRHFKITGAVNNNMTLTFQNVILDGGKLGGGIEVASGCSLQLTNPEIRNCLAAGTVQQQAGAINTATSSILTVTNGKIYSNISTDIFGGAGIYANSSTSITLNGCEIYENTASANGGGIKDVYKRQR